MRGSAGYGPAGEKIPTATASLANPMSKRLSYDVDFMD
jgi:hypothetical protein